VVHLINTTNAPSDSLWHHVAAVCDESNGRVSLYVDGILRGTTTITAGTGLLSSTRSMSIGARQSGNGTPFDNQFVGLIDEVALYRTALSSNQVLNHYPGGWNRAPDYPAAPIKYHHQ
jgi:Pentaxin family.